MELKTMDYGAIELRVLSMPIVLVHGEEISTATLLRYLAMKDAGMNVRAEVAIPALNGRKPELVIVDEAELLSPLAEYLIQNRHEYFEEVRVAREDYRHPRVPQSKGERKRNRRYRW